MSKAGEKAVWALGRFFIGMLALLPALPLCAVVDQPDAAKLSGNAYHDGGWISYGTSINKENGYLQFTGGDDYVYSPRYAAPIRKIVMEARCSADKTPPRFLTVMPYVLGTEAPALAVTNAVYAGKDKLMVVSFDFGRSEDVDAFRLGMTSGNSGNWGVTRFAVIYGTKTDDEDALLREFAQQLPVPENLALTGLTPSSLEVSASAVDDAVGYCFELTKLTGCPRTELREDFVSAPNLSDGWSCDVPTEGFKLSDGGKFYSETAAGDEHALKIERGTSSKEQPVELGFVSPLSPESLAEWSFVARIGSTGKSNRFAILGRTSAETDEWIELAKELTPGTTGSTRFAGTIDLELDIRQVRFVLTASANSWTTTGLDSLCVVYGGDEAREFVSAQTNATPKAAWQGLASGRYGYRVKALGATEGDRQFKDSAWSEELAVDLAWADIRLSSPENLAYEVSGDKLNLSWTPVAGADHYEVTVALADDIGNSVATLVTKGASASVQIAELGDYVATVKAVSPGGVSTATASLENCTVALGKVTELEVKATAADTIAATWKDVPLAESYQAKLFKVTGTAGTAVSDYSKLAEGVWPDGWEHYSYDKETYSGNPKLKYRDSWIKTETYPQPITEVKFSFKSHVSGALAEEVTKTFIRVEGSADGVTWNEIAAHQVKTTMQSITEIVPYGEGLRRIRFSVQYVGEDPNYTSLNIEFGKVTVSYGEYVRTEVESVGTKECAVTYRGLDRTAKYVVVVTPQPSEGTDCEASSVVVDLASEYFRPVGPVSIAGCKGVYLQRFDALAVITKETELRRVPLENWQFFRGSGEAESLFYTSGTNSTKGGVYCYSDAERTTESFMIGTVATKDLGSSIGLAFVNDTGSSLGAPTLTFTAVRKNEKTGEPYQLEWLVTDGPWSIGTESEDWTPLPFTEGISEFSVTPENCRLAPGQVIVFRWRQEKVTGGPMLGLDDVHVEFPVKTPGLKLQVR